MSQNRPAPRPSDAVKTTATLEASFRRYHGEDSAVKWLYFVLKQSNLTLYEAKKYLTLLRAGDYMFYTTGGGLRIL